jgi:hypothetical protein
MLGHDSLGRWALGQLPSAETGAAVAPGAILTLTLTLVAGAASGEGVLPIYGGGIRRRAATAPGALFELRVSLRVGHAHGIERHKDGFARGEVLPLSVTVIAGSASGDTVSYDNNLMMLLAA